MKTMRIALLLACCVALAGVAFGGEIIKTWTAGGLSDLEWSVDANWDTGAPDNPAMQSLYFLEDTSETVSGIVTSIVDPQNSGGNTDTWTIGNMLVRANLQKENNKYHTIDLYDADASAARTLMINNSLTVTFGVLTPIDGLIGFDPAAEIHLATGASDSGNCHGVLDLTNCSVVNNELVVDVLTAGTYASYWGALGKLIIRDTTGLTKFQVNSSLLVGTRLTSWSCAWGYIGDPDSIPAWQMPENVDIQFGAVDNPCAVEIGARGSDRGREGIMRGSVGGALSLNVSEMTVGEYIGDRDQSSTHTGILDLGNMASCTGTIGLLEVGVIEREIVAGSDIVSGLVSLPPGTVAIDAIVLGETRIKRAESHGLLQLNGTQAAVATSVTILPTGRVETIVSETSAGLDLASGATLDVADGGAINIVFDAEQSPAGGEYWGLRWEGDHRAALSDLADAGKLTWDDELVNGTAVIKNDATHTYVAVTSIWITGFSASDPETGDTFFTDSALVDIAMTIGVAPGATATGYMVTESPVQPTLGDAGWSGTVPTPYTITGPQGPVSLYGWAKNDQGTIACAQQDIVFNSALTTITNVQTAPEMYAIGLSWDTNVNALGWVMYSESGGLVDQMTDFTPYDQLHTVTVGGLEPGTSYDLVIHSNSASHALTVSTLAVPPTNDDLTWSNGPGNMLWSDGLNWDLLQPPADGTTGTLSFLDDTSDASAGVVTSILDPQSLSGNDPSDDTWNVGNILVKANLFNQGNRYHTLQLYSDGSPKTLIVDSSLTVTFGVFAPVDGLIGFDPAAHIHLADQSNDTPNCHGVLDLTNCGLVNNELVVDVLTAGDYGSYWGSVGKVIITDTTGLTKFQVVEELTVGCPNMNTYGRAYGYIGDPDSLDPEGGALPWQMPADVDIQFGSETTQGTVTVGASYMFGGSEGIMRASTGGTLTANVSTMTIGWWRGERTDTEYHRGILDLAGMDNCTGSIDALEVGTIGPVTSSAENEQIVGYVGLPPGSIATSTVVLGASRIAAAGSEGRLVLNGTVVTCSAGATVNQTGVLETTVSGTSAGLDLASGAALGVTAGGLINVIFDAEQSPVAGEYWGLRWEGDHSVELSDLATAGKLTWDDTTVTGTAGVYKDATHTYVALRTSWPPVAMAKDLTVEITGPTTIVIDVLDVDALPDAPGIVSRGITNASDTDADPATVTLEVTAAGTFDIELTTTNADGSASDTGTLTVIDLPAGTDGDLVWTGGASLIHIDRPEWMWGQNWEGGVPPAEPCNATLTFADLGTGTNKIASNRTVRYIEFSNPAGKHTIDLDGNTLTIIGDDEGWPIAGHVAMLQGPASAEAEITNGTLALGSVDAGSDLLVGVDANSTSTLTISSTLDCHARNINVGTATNAVAKLDLSGATIAGGILRAENLLLNNGPQSTNSQVILSETTGLQELAVTGTMAVAYGTYTWARIGDPLNDWKLPPNTIITLGDDGIGRGELYVARSGYGGCDGSLVAGAGGTFSAYLSRLSVGSTRDQGSPTAVLDLSEMDSCNIDATEIGIGYYLPPNAPAGGREIDARAYLPEGTVVTDVLKVDVETNSSGTSASLLELNGTAVTVNTSVAIGHTGTIQTNVSGASCGLDLADGATLTIDDGGWILLNFEAPAPGHTGIYSGLRMEGDHVLELEALNHPAVLKLHWNDTLLELATGDKVTIFADDTHTYVGVDTVTTEKLPGDVNGDCVVNILDLIGIRNHLNQDPTTPPENAPYDVNSDGSINILDMIFVRNRLNTTCAE